MMAEWETAASLGGLPRDADLRTDCGTPIVYLNGKENKIEMIFFTSSKYNGAIRRKRIALEENT